MTQKTVVMASNQGDVSLPITSASVDGVNVSPASATFLPVVRSIQLTEVCADGGLPLLTATASGTTPGISRTAGSLLALNGATTSGAQTVTTKMFWELVIPMTYITNANIQVNVNCVVATAANVTASTTTMTVASYAMSATGVETALTVSAAQQIPLTTAGTLSFVITGLNSGLVAGQKFGIELIQAVTTVGGGASFGQVNTVSYVA